MFRLALKLALTAAAAWAVWSFAPLGDRTLAQRWRASGDLATFLEKGWAEVTRGAQKAPPKPQARQKPAARERPSEAHTEADRRAIERILADNLAERP